jgi:hypothetical protein
LNEDNFLREEEDISNLLQKDMDPTILNALYFSLYYSGWDRKMAPKNLPNMDSLNDVIKNSLECETVPQMVQTVINSAPINDYANLLAIFRQINLSGFADYIQIPRVKNNFDSNQLNCVQARHIMDCLIMCSTLDAMNLCQLQLQMTPNKLSFL